MLIPTFTDLLSSFQEPQTRHAALVHGAVVLSLSLPVATGVALIVRKTWSRGLLLVLATATVASAWLGVLSGEGAYGAMGELPNSVSELAHIHEEMGEKLWYFALAVLAGAVGLCLKGKGLKIGGGALASVASLGAAAWVVFVAHHGGTLVYAYGVGTPKPITHEDLNAEPALPPDARLVHFRERVGPFLESNCMGCHSGPRPDGGLDMTTFDGLAKGGEHGPAVVPADPDASVLYTVLRDMEPFRMPPTGELATEGQVRAIHQWILDGAVWE